MPSSAAENLRVIPRLDDIAEQPGVLKGMPRAVLAEIRYKAVVLQAACDLELERATTESDAPRSANEAGEDDRLVTAEQAAGVLGVNRKWLYRHARSLPFTRRLGPKLLRFSEAGLRRWQQNQRP